ncbi:MAG: TraB/GumN family protein [Pseudomonadales bacterium]
MSQVRRKPHRRLPSLLLVAALGASAGVAERAPASQEFDALPGAKALAVLPARPDSVRGLVHSQPNALAASVQARELCQQQAGQDGACELIRLDDERITSGAEIRSQIPSASHPLFLWRYQRNGTVVYLAGSIHILKPSLYPLAPQLNAAFDQADYLVLEVDVASLDPQVIQQRTREYALLDDGETLTELLTPRTREKLTAHLADYGMTPAMLDRAKPALVMNQIVVSRLLTLGYLPDSGLESYFLARRTRQRVLELESLDEQLALLFNQPMATQIELLDETLEVTEQIEPMLAGMLVAWLSGDDARFMELFKAQTGDSELSQAFSRALLQERNHTMAAGIRRFLEDARPEQPRTYFVLVGAAHLVGDEGIVPLLARQGISGTRVRSGDRIAAPAR